MALFIYLLCVIGPFVFLIVYAMVLYSRCEKIPKSVYEEDEECVDAFYDDDTCRDPAYYFLAGNNFYDDD